MGPSRLDRIAELLCGALQRPTVEDEASEIALAARPRVSR